VNTTTGTAVGASAEPAGVPPSTDPPKRRHTRAWVVVGILAFLALLPLRGLLRNQGPPMEEGFMLVFPERVLKGDLPNRDFLHLYGPGSLWALAGAYKVFGVSLLVERLFGFAQQMAIVAGVFLLARRWGRVAALSCAAISCIIIMPPIGLTALAWVGAVGLGMLALDAALAASRAPGTGRRRHRLLVTAGLLAGATLLFRLDLVVAITLAGVALFPLFSGRERRTLLLSLAAGLSPYLIHLATAGPGNVVRGMILDPVVYLRGGRRLSIPPPPGHLEGFLQRAGELRKLDWPLPTLRSPTQLTLWFFVLLFAVAALVFTGWRLVRADRTSVRGRALFAAGLFSVGLLPQAIQRTDSTHFAWVSCVPLALLPLACIEWSRLRFAWPERTRELVAGALVLALLVFVLPRFTVQQFADYTLQTFGKHREAYKIERNGRVFYYGKRAVAEALPGLIHDLDRASRPGDSLLVGTTDLRKTPYSDAFLYYLFPELKPATYYIEMDPGVANADDSKLAGEVRKADFLVLSSVWNDWSEPNDSRNFGSDVPNQIVRRDFCKLGDYQGQYELYERCAKLHPKP
jgi:hypothetical protein